MKFQTCGFENLHVHSDFSLLDGVCKPDDLAARCARPEVNQKFLITTDHGSLGSTPSLIRACDDHNLTPLFGIEGYINPIQEPCTSKEQLDEFISHLSDEDKPRWRKSYHILMIAFNTIGYKNLVKLCSWGYSHGYGGLPRRPRINREMLLKHKEGLIITSGCYMSECGQAFDRGGEEAGFAMIEQYMAMFGENFYLELMLLDFKKQKPYDAFLIKAHDKYHIPLICSCDAHYANPEDSKYQRYMLMVRTENTIKDIEEAIKKEPDTDKFFELQDQNLWMKSEEELNEKWLSDYQNIIPYELFCQAKAETVKICHKAKGVEIDRSIKLPQIPDADQKLKELVMQGFKQRGLSGKRYAMRLKEEYELICRKGFASYFLIQQQMVNEARRVCPEILGWGDGDEAVGPGRGSAVSSLCCYCLGITDVDPVHHDLLFSRFISEARGGRQLVLRFKNSPIVD